MNGVWIILKQLVVNILQPFFSLLDALSLEPFVHICLVVKIMGKIGSKAPSSSISKKAQTSPPPPPPPPAQRPSEPRPTPSAPDSDSDLLGDDEPTVVAKAAPAPKAPSPPPKPPAPAPAPVPAPKKLGMGFFKRGPGRPTDLETVLADAKYDPEFASQVVSSLAGAVNDGRFDSFKVSFEVEGGTEAEALAALMASRGISAAAAAETLAGAVNAMLISLVDSAASAASDGSSGDEAALEAVGSLQEFMSHAGALFGALATGVSIAPVKYSGKTSKANLEGLFTMCVLTFHFAASMLTLRDLNQDTMLQSLGAHFI